MDTVQNDNTETEIDDQLFVKVMLRDTSATISYATFQRGNEQKQNEHKQKELFLKDIEILEKHFTKENEGKLKK